MACLRVPPGASAERLERFVEQGGYMVTTGQQPALAGGPLYSVVKALSAARLAEALEARLDRPVIPLFWVASEDHDWEEANHADLIGTDNELRRYELEAPDPERRPALHRVRLDAQISVVLDAMAQNVPDTEFSTTHITSLRDGFAQGRTLPEGFSDLMATLLGRFGIFLTDAADPALKEASRGLLLDELERTEELEAVLSRAASELEALGHSPQVPILPEGVNLFLEGPAGRERLYRNGTGFVLRSSGATITAEEVAQAVETDPAALSPNVLLRPVVESAVFPTLSYVGGPGEIAYFGQLREYFDAHSIEMPVIFPRWSVTVVESKIRKVLDKFDVEVDALARPFHEIAGETARDEVPDSVRAALGKLRGSIGSGVGELQSAIREVDPTLKGPVQHLRSAAFAAVDDLEKTIVQAVKRETDIKLAQLEKAQLHLFPGGKPAERVQSPLYFLARYGDAFLDALHERFEVNLD